MKKLSYAGISAISPENVKDIQVLLTVVAVIAFVLFSFNFQVQAGDSKAPVQADPLDNHAQVARVSYFSKLDINQDGRLSRQEASVDETFKNRFDVIDTDVNGSIDSSEYSVYLLTTSPN